MYIAKKGVNMNKSCELNAKELSLYIQKFYKEKYEENINKRDISPIKLQKSLYFLFAYWGQFIGKAKEENSSVEINFNNFSEYLFDEDIQAWTYGPVIPEIYNWEKSRIIKNEKIPNNYLEKSDDELVIKEFIDYLLPQLFDISDFGLVDLSHQDECWKRHYNAQANEHKEVIPKEEIIYEYCNK